MFLSRSGRDESEPHQQCTAKNSYQLGELFVRKLFTTTHLLPHLFEMKPDSLHKAAQKLNLGSSNVRLQWIRNAVGYRPILQWRREALRAQHRFTRLKRADAAGRYLVQGGHFERFRHLPRTMIDENHVATRNTNVRQRQTFRRWTNRRQTQRKRQRIFRRPLDIDDRLIVKFVYCLLHSRETNRMTMRPICVRRRASLWSQHFFKDQNVAGLELQRSLAYGRRWWWWWFVARFFLRISLLILLVTLLFVVRLLNRIRRIFPFVFQRRRSRAAR